MDRYQNLGIEIQTVGRSLNYFMKRNLVGLLVVCAAVLVMSGCSSGPVAWNVSITKNTTASIQVDLVGVASASEEAFFSGVSADEYWKPNSTIRNDQRKLGNLQSMSLQMGKPWILPRNDPQWQAWMKRGVSKIYVIARLPEAVGNWKVALPLGKKAWVANDKTLEIVVVDSGISVQTKSRD